MANNLRHFCVALAMGACLYGLGCGDAADSTASREGAPPSGNQGRGGSAAFDPSLGPGVTAGTSATPPPEKEIESSFRAPVITGSLVWAANPTSGRVALINAKTLAVALTNAGLGPTYVAAVPTADASESVIVLNVGSADATWFRADPSGNISATAFRTHVGANTWAVNNDGRWAIAWSQSEGAAEPDLIEGFQEITVLNLQAAATGADPQNLATRLTVGFRPSQIAFNAEGTRAFAVVDDGISVIELGAAPRVSELIEVSDTPLEDIAHDISFTPDGAFAFVRIDGRADIGVIDLKTSSRRALTLSGPVTDVDLSADGKRAFAMIGEASDLVIIPVPPPETGAAFEHVVIDGEQVRSVAVTKAADTALLYTTAVANSHLTIVRIDPAQPDYLSHRTLELKGPLKAVFPSSDSETAVTLQGPAAGSTKAGVFSAVPLRSVRSPKIVGTDAPPLDIAVNGGHAIVTVSDPKAKKYGVYTLELANLREDFFPLASEPLKGAAGMVPEANRGFVAQRHPEGRITFVELGGGRVNTLTGFEISARVK